MVCKDVHTLILEPMNTSLYLAKGFTNMIKVKDLEMRSSWITKVSSVCSC